MTQFDAVAPSSVLGLASHAAVACPYGPVTLRVHNAITRHNGATELGTMEAMIDSSNGIPAASSITVQYPDGTVHGIPSVDDVARVQDAIPGSDRILDVIARAEAAIAQGLPPNGRARRIAKRKARKAAERTAQREAQPSNGQSLAPGRPASRAAVKSRTHGKLDMDGVKASAELAVKMEVKQFLLTARAVKAFENATSTRDAALAVVNYFGENIHKGIVRPLWSTRIKSQRDAVAEVWGIGSDDKAILDAKVQIMIRLRVMGYGLLGIPVPVKGGGRPPAPILDMAFGRIRNLLADKMDQGERLAFLARVRDAVKALNAGKPLSKAS